ncbi:MAG: carbamate kinase [Actinobacteria bacterium]|nr:carbamate kinase [Actinomycetota bacterium]MBA3738403.1 carbamate kinase [Actinomycetota bacterium]
MTTVVALGGNALIRKGDRGTAAEQSARLREAAGSLAPLLGEPRLVITHGNGPQVGNELIRQERAADEVPPLPLYLAVAQTQAEIGAMIVTELGRSAGRPVACLLTHVVVADDDPAFDRPSKPIGPFYSSEEAAALERDRGWTLVEEQGRGFRRAVPSPTPLEVVELDQIRALLDAGAIPVACGGGGIPVVRDGDRIRGVDAVIDKDRASAVLAKALGAERLVILTDVAAVKRGFRTSDEEVIAELTADEAEALLPDLAEGSMRPKVEAAITIARAGGEALITALESLEAALAGSAGTRIRG